MNKVLLMRLIFHHDDYWFSDLQEVMKFGYSVISEQ